MNRNIPESPEHNLKLRHVAGLFLLIFIIVIIIRVFFMDFYRIPSESMKDTFHEGDIIATSKVYYFIGLPYYLDKYEQYKWWYKKPKVDDIICFVNDDQILVKRIVAVPGEYIYTNPKNFKTSYSNMEPLKLPEAGSRLILNYYNFNLYSKLIIMEGNSILKVEDGYMINTEMADYYQFKYSHYYVLGDNLDNSYDSRDFGTVMSKDIIGVPVLKIFGKNAPALIE